MFCPQCGADNATNLKFCTRCGMNLEALSRAMTNPQNQDTMQSAISPDHVRYLLRAIVAIVVGGIGALGGIVVALLAMVNNPDEAFLFGVFGLVTITIIAILLVRLLGRKIAVPEADRAPATADKPAFTNPAYLPPPSVGSVVESSTSRLPAQERRTTG